MIQATQVFDKIKSYHNDLKYINSRLISDVDAQPLIEHMTPGDAETYFFDNLSDGYSIDDLQRHLETRLLESIANPNGEILCSHNNVQERKRLDKALYMRKINSRATPIAKDVFNGGWIKEYALPPFMSFDVDANKDDSPFNRLFPHYNCYDIHDALDIARPLVTVINPVTGNCQFVYELRWTEADYTLFQTDEETFKQRYDTVRKKLSWLFGADAHFVNHIIRSPLFVAGWHRLNPLKSTSRKRLKLDEDSLFHFSKWYNPKAYTLREMESLADDLYELHIKFLDNDKELKALGAIYKSSVSLYVLDKGHDLKGDLPSNNAEESTLAKQQALALNPQTVTVGERNICLFDYVRFKAYEVACRFKQRDDVQGFIEYLLPIACQFNDKFHKPLSRQEVTYTIKSIVKWCLSRYKGGLSSEEATRINLEYRWRDHKKVARRKLVERSCKVCGDDITRMNKQATTCSAKCRKALYRANKLKCERVRMEDNLV